MFAGVVVALVVQFILNLFGVGIGAATLDPGTGANPSAMSFSMVTRSGWTLSGIIASFAGSYEVQRVKDMLAAQ